VSRSVHGRLQSLFHARDELANRRVLLFGTLSLLFYTREFVRVQHVVVPARRSRRRLMTNVIIIIIIIFLPLYFFSLPVRPTVAPVDAPVHIIYSPKSTRAKRSLVVSRERFVFPRRKPDLTSRNTADRPISRDGTGPGAARLYFWSRCHFFTCASKAVDTRSRCVFVNVDMI